MIPSEVAIYVIAVELVYLGVSIHWTAAGLLNWEKYWTGLLDCIIFLSGKVHIFSKEPHN